AHATVRPHPMWRGLSVGAIAETLRLRAAAELERRRRARARQGPLWTPHPGPQTEFLQSDAFEALYGGAAGGGKSWALVHDALRGVGNPHFVGILFRNSFPGLGKNPLPEAKRTYPRLGAAYSEGKKLWTFPSGALIYFGYLERDADDDQYQGAEFQYVGFDELTHFNRYQFTYLISRLRGPHGIKPRIRATTNP